MNSLRRLFVCVAWCCFLVLLGGCCMFFPRGANCPPDLSVEPSSLNFGTSEAQRSIAVSNDGGGTLNWSVSEKPEWITCTPNSGSGNHTVVITLNRSLLAVGNNTSQIAVTSPDGGVQYIDVAATEEPRDLSYTISVTTTDIEDAGTDANVYVELWGMRGAGQTYSGVIELDNPGENNFEQGHTDQFVRTLPNLGEIRKVCIKHDNANRYPGWHLSTVKVVDSEGRNWTFSFNQWLATDEPPHQLSACRER